MRGEREGGGDKEKKTEKKIQKMHQEKQVARGDKGRAVRVQFGRPPSGASK